MKKHSHWIGLLVLLLVMAGALTYVYFSGTGRELTTVSGFVSGDKLELLQDPRVEGLLRRKYQLELDISKAGSLEMIEAEQRDSDFLFPAGEAALELFKAAGQQARQDEVTFSSPLVLYAYKPVADALIEQGIAVRSEQGVYTVDMLQLSRLLEEGRSWNELGLIELFGPATVSMTHPLRSNSGYMFSGLLANMLNEGEVVQGAAAADIQPRLTKILDRLGYMEPSSADLWDKFIQTGMGAAPLIVGYENQLLEFSKMHAKEWEKVQDQIVMLYPQPTVWAAHSVISLTAEGDRLLVALRDPELLRLAWSRHGFRSAVSRSEPAGESFAIEGIADQLSSVIALPGQTAMAELLNQMPY